jgi:hypothetical protein
MAFERGFSQPTSPQPRGERISRHPEEEPFELPPDSEDIKAFFRSIGREDLIGSDAGRDRLAREAVLVDALESAKYACKRDWKTLSGDERKTRQAEVNFIRKLIWRLSTLKENVAPSRTEAVASARDIAHGIEGMEHERTGAPNDYQDWKEAQTERADLYRLLADAFEHDTVGNAPIPHDFLAQHPHILLEHGPKIRLTRFFDQIEYEYRDQERRVMTAYDRRRRKDEEQKLQHLRAVRDELYLSFLFPKLASGMHASEEREREEGKKRTPRKRAA